MGSICLCLIVIEVLFIEVGGVFDLGVFGRVFLLLVGWEIVEVLWGPLLELFDVRNLSICCRVRSVLSCSGLIEGVDGSRVESSDRILIRLIELMFRSVLRFKFRSSMFLG